MAQFINITPQAGKKRHCRRANEVSIFIFRQDLSSRTHGRNLKWIDTGVFMKHKRKIEVTALRWQEESSAQGYSAIKWGQSWTCLRFNHGQLSWNSVAVFEATAINSHLPCAVHLPEAVWGKSDVLTTGNEALGTYNIQTSVTDVCLQ